MKPNTYSQNKIPLLYNEDSNNRYDLAEREMNMYSTLNDDSNNKRRSMFLSPTAEVMSFNKNQTHHQRMVSSFTIQSNDQSYEAPQQSERGSNRQHKATPSAYMDNMFDD